MNFIKDKNKMKRMMYIKIALKNTQKKTDNDIFIMKRSLYENNSIPIFTHYFTQ